jgi:hypothetical protein
MIDFLKKYKTQIFNIITIFLILEFVIFPALTKADTISNIFAAIGLLLLIVWGGLALYTYVKGNEPTKKSNPKQFDGVSSDEPFVKTRKKNKSIVKIDFTDAKGMNEIAGVINPIAEGRVKISVENPKPKTEKVLGEFQINNKEKVRKSVSKKTK